MWVANKDKLVKYMGTWKYLGAAIQEDSSDEVSLLSNETHSFPNVRKLVIGNRKDKRSHEGGKRFDEGAWKVYGCEIVYNSRLAVVAKVTVWEKMSEKDCIGYENLQKLWQCDIE